MSDMKDWTTEAVNMVNGEILEHNLYIKLILSAAGGGGGQIEHLKTCNKCRTHI